MIAPPNNGSAKSLVLTHEGVSFSVLLDAIPSGMVATLPSIYQLFPNGPDPAVFDETTGEALDHYDIETWDRRGWGIGAVATLSVFPAGQPPPLIGIGC